MGIFRNFSMKNGSFYSFTYLQFLCIKEKSFRDIHKQWGLQVSSENWLRSLFLAFSNGVCYLDLLILTCATRGCSLPWERNWPLGPILEKLTLGPKPSRLGCRSFGRFPHSSDVIHALKSCFSLFLPFVFCSMYLSIWWNLDSLWNCWREINIMGTWHGGGLTLFLATLILAVQ